MKKVLFLITVILILCAPNLKAQGTITYFNGGIEGPGRTIYDAPVFMPDGTTRVEGPAFTAGLFFNNLLVPGSAQPFLTGINAGFFTPVIFLTIPGVPAGSTPTFEVRVWNTSAGSYDNAIATSGLYLRSVPFTVPPLGGVNPAPNPLPPSFSPGTLTGLQFPTPLVPEPSTYALGMLGLGALALMRRRA